MYFDIGPSMRRQRGLSLIELLVGVALGLVLLVSLGYLLIGSRSSFQSQDAISRLQETGRLVMDSLSRDLRLAGRVAICPVSTDSRIEWPTDVLPIEGTDGTQDTLTIRYQLDDVSGGEIEDCNGHSGSTLSGGKVRVGETDYYYSVVENIYSVSQTTSSGTVTSTSMVCDGNGGTTAQPFADNVEDFQVLYGLDTDNDYSANQYVSAGYFAVSAQTWYQVVSVRLCVLIRSEAGAVTGSQTYVNCAGTTSTSSDGRLRRAFTSVYNLRNRNKASE
jgi:type IV pilus assembly protein PilW